MSYKDALQLLQLPAGTEPERAYPVWRQAHVAARRAGDDERERVLSQVRQAIRKRTPRRCAVCNCVVSRMAVTCDIHRPDLHSVRYPIRRRLKK